MSTTRASTGPGVRPSDEPGWTCAACGHLNRPADVGRSARHAAGRSGGGGADPYALVCAACGVAKRYLAEPPLDLPARPALTEVPSFWFGLGWLLAAAVGGAALLSPSLLAFSGMGRNFLLFEVGASLYAAASSALNAVWERWFNQVELVVPHHAATGDRFAATLTLVPYISLDGVNVSIRLLDRFYERNPEGQLTTRSRVLGAFSLLRRGALQGRREATFEAGFIAPFPATKHSDVMAEISADVLDLLGNVVPALRWNARNLREHGGYVVETTVRVGLVVRRLRKRVLAYHIGEQVHFG